MTQEEKELLLKDLCVRLPYGVKVQLNIVCKIECLHKILAINPTSNKILINHYESDAESWKILSIDSWVSINDIKPYLRSMSSMTEEEKETYQMFFNEDGLLNTSIDTYLDWLLEGHFDFRGLIPKGLALEAKDWMYKTKQDESNNQIKSVQD